MDFTLNTEQAQLQDSLRRYLRDHYAFEERVGRMARGAVPDRTVWSQFAELGLLAAGLPEEAGGWGSGAIETAVVMQELGRSLVLEPYVENAVLAARLLLHCGDPRIRSEHLTALAGGEHLYAPALHEAARDFLCEHCATMATPVAGGYRLDGRKLLVKAGGAADRLLVLASLADSGERGIFVVDPARSGVAVDTYATFDCGSAADVGLSGAFVPVTALLVKGDAAKAAVADAIDHAIVALCAESVGCMDAAIELTTTYLRERKQFGRPLADFQVLQHRMADMFVQADFARSMTYQALAALDRAPYARARAVSAAKVRVDEASHFVGGEVVHNHGGMGLTEEYPAGHYFRRLVAIRQSFGDAAFHLNRYSRLAEAG